MNIQKPKSITYEHIRTMNRALKTGNQHVISVIKKVRESKNPDELKETLRKADQKTKDHKTSKKPDNLADDILQLARKLRSESRLQPFSKNAQSLIQDSVLILEKIINKCG